MLGEGGGGACAQGKSRTHLKSRLSWANRVDCFMLLRESKGQLMNSISCHLSASSPDVLVLVFWHLSPLTEGSPDRESSEVGPLALVLLSWSFFITPCHCSSHLLELVARPLLWNGGKSEAPALRCESIPWQPARRQTILIIWRTLLMLCCPMPSKSPPPSCISAF